MYVKKHIMMPNFLWKLFVKIFFLIFIILLPIKIFQQNLS